MKPMGYDDKAIDDLIEERRQLEVSSSTEPEPTEIAYPEDRYGLACIGCGIEMHLQMIPHRDSHNIIVGWVFACEKCRPKIIGRRMRWGEQDFRESGTSEAWDNALHAASRLYETTAKHGIGFTTTNAALKNFVGAWNKMLD